VTGGVSAAGSERRGVEGREEEEEEEGREWVPGVPS
jgi:hypothetical protein